MTYYKLCLIKQRKMDMKMTSLLIKSIKSVRNKNAIWTKHQILQLNLNIQIEYLKNINYTKN